MDTRWIINNICEPKYVQKYCNLIIIIDTKTTTTEKVFNNKNVYIVDLGTVCTGVLLVLEILIIKFINNFLADIRSNILKTRHVALLIANGVIHRQRRTVCQLRAHKKKKRRDNEYVARGWFRDRQKKIKTDIYLSVVHSCFSNLEL